MEARQPIILLADDDEQLGEMVLYILKLKGYRVVHAVDGEMAVVMINDFQPDIVLLDVNMPKKDGFEVLRHIRSNPVFQNVKVVMFTEQSQPKDFIRAGELGADLYLAKPVDTDALVSTVKVLLKRAEPPANA